MSDAIACSWLGTLMRGLFRADGRRAVLADIDADVDQGKLLGHGYSVLLIRAREAHSTVRDVMRSDEPQPLLNGLGLQPRAAVASSWFTAELRRVHGPHLIRMSARNRTYKQLQRTVIRRRGDGASAPFHYALAPRFTRQRAAAELRRYAARRVMACYPQTFLTRRAPEAHGDLSMEDCYDGNARQGETHQEANF